MSSDPLIAAALLGTARISVLPAPDPCLEEAWGKLAADDPGRAILSALALTRAMRIAGVETVADVDEESVSPPESRGYFPTVGVALALRLLGGEFPEVLPEWLRLASGSNWILPPRVLPELLGMAGSPPLLGPAALRLAGERGLWIARRNGEFAWLLDDSVVGEDAWETGQGAERIAWLRQKRAADPAAAADVIASHWAGEDATMRDGIMRLISGHPTACDEAWLQSHALADRRQDIRELAAACLMRITGSGFRSRAIARVLDLVRTERRLMKRVIKVIPPAAFDPAWAAEGIKQKPPQGIGEKAWWLRQMAALVPLDDWPELLAVGRDDLFALAREKDWEEPLLAGWIEAARRFPDRALAETFIPFIAITEPWPQGAHPRLQLLHGLLDAMSAERRHDMLDRLAKILAPALALDLLARCGSPESSGKGMVILSVLEKEMAATATFLTRPQARALATCVPAAQIQACLEGLAKLPGISPSAEDFATVLEFRRSMISQFQLPSAR